MHTYIHTYIHTFMVHALQGVLPSQSQQASSSHQVRRRSHVCTRRVKQRDPCIWVLRNSQACAGALSVHTCILTYIRTETGRDAQVRESESYESYVCAHQSRSPYPRAYGGF
jgi:hypothetical protein